MDGDVDYRLFYNLDTYLFGDVAARFRDQGWLSAFDLLCIGVWRANRSKGRFLQRLLAHGAGSLDDGAQMVTPAIFRAPDPKAHLRILVEE